MESDERYMWMALDLARQGLGKTNPNPMVGAVLVKDGEVVGTGFHAKAGLAHAEIIALQDACEKARGATLFVNLEPCSHQGRTPPCVDAIIEGGIRKVVMAMKDPNPLVSGQGIKKLEKAGIKVKTGVLEEKALRLNEVFIKYITTRLPFVVVKSAMTLDGKIATQQGESQWISGEKSRELVHKLRSLSDGIMVGINTVLHDNPRLTVRLGKEEQKAAQPLRIIVDSQGRLPLDSNVSTGYNGSKTLLATTDAMPKDKKEALMVQGVDVLTLPDRDGRVDLAQLMIELGKREISALLVEGGGALNYALLESNLIDKVYLFLAPLLLGGENAPTPFEGEGVNKLTEAWVVENVELKQLDNDLLVIGYPARRDADVHGNRGGTRGAG